MRYVMDAVVITSLLVAALSVACGDKPALALALCGAATGAWAKDLLK